MLPPKYVNHCSIHVRHCACKYPDAMVGFHQQLRRTPESRRTTASMGWLIRQPMTLWSSMSAIRGAQAWPGRMQGAGGLQAGQGSTRRTPRNRQGWEGCSGKEWVEDDPVALSIKGIDGSRRLTRWRLTKSSRFPRMPRNGCRKGCRKYSEGKGRRYRGTLASANECPGCTCTEASTRPARTHCCTTAIASPWSTHSRRITTRRHRILAPHEVSPQAQSRGFISGTNGTWEGAGGRVV